MITRSFGRGLFWLGRGIELRILHSEHYLYDHHEAGASYGPGRSPSRLFLFGSANTPMGL